MKGLSLWGSGNYNFQVLFLVAKGFIEGSLNIPVLGKIEQVESRILVGIKYKKNLIYNLIIKIILNI